MLREKNVEGNQQLDNICSCCAALCVSLLHATFFRLKNMSVRERKFSASILTTEFLLHFVCRIGEDS